MSKYKQGTGSFDLPINKTRCRESVWDKISWKSHQCTRKVVVDGEWCKQHDPETIKRKRAAKHEAAVVEQAAKMRVRVAYGLQHATDGQILHECKRRMLEH